MAGQRMGMGHATRFAVSLVQGVMGLFTAGAVLYEAHRLFLWYYAREMIGIEVGGVNGCVGEDRVANGDLLYGQTFCNKPENLAPWFQIYRNHPLEASVFYAAVVFGLLLIGALWLLSHRQAAPVDPTTQQPHGQNTESHTI